MLAVIARVECRACAKGSTIASLFARAMVAVGIGIAQATTVLCHAALQPVQHVGQCQAAIFALPCVWAGTTTRNAHTSTASTVVVTAARLASAWNRAFIKRASRPVEHGVFRVVPELHDILRAVCQCVCVWLRDHVRFDYCAKRQERHVQSSSKPCTKKTTIIRLTQTIYTRATAVLPCQCRMRTRVDTHQFLSHTNSARGNGVRIIQPCFSSPSFENRLGMAVWASKVVCLADTDTVLTCSRQRRAILTQLDAVGCWNTTFGIHGTPVKIPPCQNGHVIKRTGGACTKRNATGGGLA